jgi:hypothetical protein
MMARGSSETPIACEQHSIERFGKGDVDSVVRREIVPQIPNARQKETMRISLQRKIREIGDGSAAAFAIDLAIRRIPTDDLRDFHVEQMRCVECLAII